MPVHRTGQQSSLLFSFAATDVETSTADTYLTIEMMDGNVRRTRSRRRILPPPALAAFSLCLHAASPLSFDVSFRSTTAPSSCGSPLAWTHQPRGGGGAPPMTMKVSGSSGRSRSDKSSLLIELNNERIRTAGRRGTKKFVDPLKVFIGNLPFDADESDIEGLFASHWGCTPDNVGERIESVKVIRDWKTGKSKGYGFVQFYEPMIATSAMESMNKGKGWKIKGRRIRLDQGKKKGSDVDEREMKKRKKQQKQKQREDLDEEGLVIHSALESVENGEEEEEEGGMTEDEMIAFMEKGGLRGVMPLTEETAGFLGIEGLYDDDDEDDYGEFYAENGYSDEDYGEIKIDGDDEDGELKYDGVFEEVYSPEEFELGEDEKAMNREQRRAAEKKKKKRKLPFKGFGSRS